MYQREQLCLLFRNMRYVSARKKAQLSVKSGCFWEGVVGRLGWGRQETPASYLSLSTTRLRSSVRTPYWIDSEMLAILYFNIFKIKMPLPMIHGAPASYN